MDVAEDDLYRARLYKIAVVLDHSFKFYWIRDLQLAVHAENHLKQNIIQLIIHEMQRDSTLSSRKLEKTYFIFDNIITYFNTKSKTEKIIS